MATRIVAARGSDWSEPAVRDGWGPDATVSEINEFTKAVVSRFEELALAAGVNAAWFPRLGEVHCDQGDPDVDLDTLRLQASEEVWDKVIYGE